ncbi:MAG: Rrf2 family transcriptional regulator [Phycisphaerales bacterium]|nr:Rrf2 family transcriptional regulator [Phycisphaerales bacterium]
MLSRTSEYALRAMVCLTRHVDEWPIPGPKIAEETGIPRKYLSNVLGQLVRAGVLVATPGVGGGFRMVRRPQEVRLHEILTPFEPALGPSRPCPFGNEICGDANPCAGHARWKSVRDAYGEFLRTTSIQDVSVGQNGASGNGSGKRERQ